LTDGKKTGKKQKTEKNIGKTYTPPPIGGCVNNMCTVMYHRVTWRH